MGPCLHYLVNGIIASLLSEPFAIIATGYCQFDYNICSNYRARNKIN